MNRLQLGKKLPGRKVFARALGGAWIDLGVGLYAGGRNAAIFLKVAGQGHQRIHLFPVCPEPLCLRERNILNSIFDFRNLIGTCYVSDPPTAFNCLARQEIQLDFRAADGCFYMIGIDYTQVFHLANLNVKGDTKKECAWVGRIRTSDRLSRYQQVGGTCNPRPRVPDRSPVPRFGLFPKHRFGRSSQPL